MGLGEWAIAFFGLLLIGVFVYIIVRENKNYKIIKAKDVRVIKTETKVQKPKVDFFDAKVLKKRIHVYYENQINIPLSKTEYWIMFQIRDGEKKEFMVPQELFERTNEGQDGTLVTTNGQFFDFGDGEEIKE
jgi:hypothetical protein